MKSNKIHSIKYNFIMNFLLSSSSFVFPLITFPYISRVLGAEGNGRISFYSSIANYFLLVASLGIPTYGIRACAKVRDDIETLSKTVKEIFTINKIMTVLVIISYFITFLFVGKFQQEFELFFINGLNIVLNMFGMTWFFQALEQYDYITIRSLLAKVISVILMLTFVHSPSDYKIQASISILAACGFNLINYVCAKKYVQFNYELSNLDLKKHLKPITILFAQSLAVSIYTNLDTVMLGFIKSNSEVGYYNAAIKLKYILLSLVASLGQVLLPRMSYFVQKNLKKEFLSAMRKALNFTCELSFPLVGYFSIFSNEVMLFLAGNGYKNAVPAMQIITIAILPIGLTGILGTQVLTSIEKEKNVLYSVIIGAISDFILNLILIPDMGATGAALATTICEFIVLLVQVYFCKNFLGEIWKELKPMRYLIITLISTLVAIPIKIMGISSVFMCLILSATLFYTTYSLCLIVIKDELMVQFFLKLGSGFNKKMTE